MTRNHFVIGAADKAICGRALTDSTHYAQDRKSFAHFVRAGVACEKCTRKLSAIQDDEAAAASERAAQENAKRVGESENAKTWQTFIRRTDVAIADARDEYRSAVQRMIQKLAEELRRVEQGDDLSTTVMMTSLVTDINQLPVKVNALREQRRSFIDAAFYVK